VIELVLVGRPLCHLCEDMEYALAPLLAEYGASLTVLNVDREPGLERFSELIPVLLLNGEEICRYFVDELKVRKVLSVYPADSD